MFNSANGIIDIEYSTLSGNHANSGGGLFVYASAQTRLIKNSKVSGNSPRYDGGGIFSYYPLDVYNSTTTKNSADGNSLGGSSAGITFHTLPPLIVATWRAPSSPTTRRLAAWSKPISRSTSAEA